MNNLLIGDKLLHKNDSLSPLVSHVILKHSPIMVLMKKFLRLVLEEKFHEKFPNHTFVSAIFLLCIYMQVCKQSIKYN